MSLKQPTALQNPFFFFVLVLINEELIIRSQLNVFTHQTCLRNRDDISSHEVSVR